MSRIEELEKQITELDERKVALQQELEVEKQKTEIEYPFDPFQDGDNYWCVSSAGVLREDRWSNHWIDHLYYQQGNAFLTEKEAQREIERRNLLTRFRQFRDKCNGDWKPALKIVGLSKYCIAINNKTDIMFAMDVTFYNEFNPFGYFKKKEDCQRAIEIFGDEIKRLYVEE